MKLIFIFFLAANLLTTRGWTGEEGMPKMPLIQPKKTFIVPTQEAGEDLLEQRGYGDQEPMVRMMNLMMVGGSGYEGMDMAEMTADTKTPGSKLPLVSDHHGHGHTSSPPVPTPAEGQTATFDFDAKITPNPPRVGTNTLEIGIQRKNKAEPATGLKIAAKVFMTSMDMGTEEPKVREIAPGRYQVKVVFSMNGPWAVKLLLPEGGEKVLNFDVGSSK